MNKVNQLIKRLNAVKPKRKHWLDNDAFIKAISNHVLNEKTRFGFDYNRCGNCNQVVNIISPGPSIGETRMRHTIDKIPPPEIVIASDSGMAFRNVMRKSVERRGIPVIPIASIDWVDLAQ